LAFRNAVNNDLSGLTTFGVVNLLEIVNIGTRHALSPRNNLSRITAVYSLQYNQILFARQAVSHDRWNAPGRVGKITVRAVNPENPLNFPVHRYIETYRPDGNLTNEAVTDR
jgi:hypothetical protein